MWKPHSVLWRDVQIVLDLCVDLYCMFVPLGWMWFSYMIPLTTLEALAILAAPSMFALGRLDELMDAKTFGDERCCTRSIDSGKYHISKPSSFQLVRSSEMHVVIKSQQTSKSTRFSIRHGKLVIGTLFHYYMHCRNIGIATMQ